MSYDEDDQCDSAEPTTINDASSAFRGLIHGQANGRDLAPWSVPRPSAFLSALRHSSAMRPNSDAPRPALLWESSAKHTKSSTDPGSTRFRSHALRPSGQLVTPVLHTAGEMVSFLDVISDSAVVGDPTPSGRHELALPVPPRSRRLPRPCLSQKQWRKVLVRLLEQLHCRRRFSRCVCGTDSLLVVERVETSTDQSCPFQIAYGPVDRIGGCLVKLLLDAKSPEPFRDRIVGADKMALERCRVLRSWSDRSSRAFLGLDAALVMSSTRLTQPSIRGAGLLVVARVP